MQDKKKRRKMYWLRRFVAKLVIGIGSLYAAVDPEIMDELVSEMQERAVNKITQHGMWDYKQLKKIEDEWVRERLIQ